MCLARKFVCAQMIFFIVRRRSCIVRMGRLKVEFCSSLVRLVRIGIHLSVSLLRD